jgi:hypothetical protein
LFGAEEAKVGEVTSDSQIVNGEETANNHKTGI